MESKDFLKPEPELTQEQQGIVDALSVEEAMRIDKAILGNVTTRYQKVSKIVGLVMFGYGSCFPGLPDIYYSKRIRSFVYNGQLVYQGYLQNMRFCEVRLPD